MKKDYERLITYKLPKDIEYQTNYCGKANNPKDPYLDAVVDDLKIYNKPLNETEILFEYNFNMNKSESN